MALTSLTPPVTGRELYSDAEMAAMDPDQTCVDCGAAVPSFPDHGIEVHERYEDDGESWNQRCPDCSYMESYSVVDSNGDVIYE